MGSTVEARTALSTHLHEKGQIKAPPPKYSTATFTRPVSCARHQQLALNPSSRQPPVRPGPSNSSSESLPLLHARAMSAAHRVVDTVLAPQVQISRSIPSIRFDHTSGMGLRSRSASQSPIS